VHTVFDNKKWARAHKKKKRASRRTVRASLIVMQAEILRQISYNTVAVRLLFSDAHPDVIMQLTFSALKGNSHDLKHASVFRPLACVIEDMGRFNGRCVIDGRIRLTGDSPALAAASLKPAQLPKPTLVVFTKQPPRPRSIYFD
jgi:hypothetical protein